MIACPVSAPAASGSVAVMADDACAPFGASRDGGRGAPGAPWLAGTLPCLLPSRLAPCVAVPPCCSADAQSRPIRVAIDAPSGRARAFAAARFSAVSPSGP
jgi:hypothetical protein